MSQVIGAPVQTFRSLAPDEGMGSAAGYLVAMKAVEAAPGIARSLAEVTLQVPDPTSAIGWLISAWVNTLVAQAMQVGMASLGLILLAMTPYIALSVLGGATRSLQDTARAMAYVIGTFILLEWIPGYGSSLAAGCLLVYGTAALHGLHGTPWWKALVAGAVAPAFGDIVGAFKQWF